MFNKAGKQVKIYSFVLGGIILAVSLILGISLIWLGAQFSRAAGYEYDYSVYSFFSGRLIFFGILTIILGMAIAWIVFYITYTFGLTAERTLGASPAARKETIDINEGLISNLSSVLIMAGGSREKAYSLLMKLSEDYYKAGMSARVDTVDRLLTSPDVLQALRQEIK